MGGYDDRRDTRDYSRDRDRDNFSRPERNGGGPQRDMRRPPRDVASMTSIRVNNINYRTSIDDLHKAFSKFGEVGDVFIPQGDRGSKGFAFVR